MPADGTRADGFEPIDADTSRRMVDGLVEPDDAPPGYALAAAVLRELRLADQPPAPDARTVRMMARIIAISEPPRRSPLGRLRPHRQ